jgi:hypothetical protein
MEDRDTGMTMSRLIFQPGQSSSDVEVISDEDMIVGLGEKERVQAYWDSKWLSKVLKQRELMSQQIESHKAQVKPIKQATGFFKEVIKRNKEPTCQLVARAGEVVLQDILGVLIEEWTDLYDSDGGGAKVFSYTQCMWLYSLLCALKMPLLPDTAADMN